MAIWKVNAPEGAPRYEELDFLDQGRVKMIARACLFEMRVPTEEMLLAGNDTYEHDMTAERWMDMIDAALKEG
jgi:hypothetical protein